MKKFIFGVSVGIALTTAAIVFGKKLLGVAKEHCDCLCDVDEDTDYYEF